MKKYTIKEPIYGSTVNLYIGCYNEFRNGLFRNHDIVIERETAPLGLCCGMNKSFHIWLPKWGSHIDDYVTLSHEVIHYSLDILDHVTEKPTSKHAEPLTYLHDWAFENLLKKLKKPPSPVKKKKAPKKRKKTKKS